MQVAVGICGDDLITVAECEICFGLFTGLKLLALITLLCVK